MLFVRVSSGVDDNLTLGSAALITSRTCRFVHIGETVHGRFCRSQLHSGSFSSSITRKKGKRHHVLFYIMYTPYIACFRVLHRFGFTTNE